MTPSFPLHFLSRPAQSPLSKLPICRQISLSNTPETTASNKIVNQVRIRNYSSHQSSPETKCHKFQFSSQTYVNYHSWKHYSTTGTRHHNTHHHSDSLSTRFLLLLERNMQNLTRPDPDASLSRPQKLSLIKTTVKDILNESQESNRNASAQTIHFNAAEREKFALLLQTGHQEERDSESIQDSSFSTARDEIRYLVGTINRYMQDQLPHQINQQKKDMLIQWMRQNGNKQPSAKEKLEIMKQIGLSRTQLRQQLSFLRDATGTLSEEVKSIVETWLNENEYRSPTSEERDHLQEKTNLGRNQLNNLIYRMREAPGEISEETKDYLRSWLQKHNNRAPTVKERDALQEETGLNKPQLYAQLSNLRKNIPKLALKKSGNEEAVKQAIDTLHKWYKKHRRQPSPEERTRLEEDTSLTTRQIYEQIRRWDDASIPVTSSMRVKIHQYLASIDFASPTSQQRDTLQQMTGLGRAQLNGLIGRIRRQVSR